MPNDEIINVRYMVDDVEESIAFYTELLGFELLTSAAPAFADVKRGNLRLLLSGPKSSAGRPMPDGATPGPGRLEPNPLHRRRRRHRGRTAPRRRRVVPQRRRGRTRRKADPAPGPVRQRRRALPAGRALNGELLTATLQRRLGLLDAVTVGAGSMIGAGVFSAWGPAADAAGTGLLDRSRGRGGRRVLQRHLLGPARRRAPRIGWDLRVRPSSTRGVLGAPRRVGVRRRQDRLVRRARAHRRRLPLARTRAPRRCRSGRGRGDRQPRRADPHRRHHQVPARGRARGARRGRRRRVVELDDLGRAHHPDRLLAGRRDARRRVPVLRLRRLRPHRHPWRGGPRPGHDHPQGDSSRPGRRAA